MVFRSKTDSGEIKKQEQQSSRLPLVITIVVLAVVGSAYYMYYRQHAEYYTGRNLRLLSMLTAQVEGRVMMFSDFVSLKAKPLNTGTSGNKTGDLASNAKLVDDVASSEKKNDELYSTPGLKFGQCTDERPEEWPKPPAGRVQMRRDVVEGSRGWKVRLQAYVDQKPATTCASVMIDDVARPIFTSDLGAAFDVVLVASDDGTVLYSIRPPPASSTLLGTKDEWIDEAEELPPVALLNPKETKTDTAAGTTAGATTTSGEKDVSADKKPVAADSSSKPAALTERDSGALVLITNLKALQKKKGGWFSEYEGIAPASLTVATGQMDVSLGGTDYVLFTQPYTYSRAPASVHGKKSNQWVVCGLVSASRFRYDVFAVSTSIVLIAIAIVLLALCCWPYLRIALIHPSQPLAITDVVLIIVCTIVGAAVITLALLDGFAYRGIAQTADEQLEELTRDEAKKAVGTPKAVQTLPKSLLGNDAAGIYPYIDLIVWIGEDGWQKVRFGRALSALKDVSARPYFKLAKEERTWTVPSDPPTPYVLEWVRSKSTGEVRAILAKKTREPVDPAKNHQPDNAEEKSPFSVIAMATSLIDISEAVPPPGAELAIIDEQGNVIYHSDTQRIGFENFFTETDRNRALRSAVVARRAGHVDATYWGNDQSMYVLPLTGSQWTLVTFRAKRLTRVLNVEATLLTLSLLLLSSTPYFFVYMAVLLLRPRYRAPRLWPDQTRHGDYLRLSFILLALLLLFCLNNYVFAPWASFAGIVIIPLLSIVTTYLVLHRTGAPRRFAIGVAVWIIVTSMLVVHMLLAEIHPERFSGHAPAIVRTIVLLATLGVALFTYVLIGRWKYGGRVRDALRSVQARYGYSTLYRACGVLLIIIGVVLPVIGFFTISRHVEEELMVKYTQLRAAAALEERIDHLVTMCALPLDVPLSTRRQVYSDIFINRLHMLFSSRWYLTPAAEGGTAPRVADEPESCTDADDAEKNWTIPAWASTWLPSLYEDSIAIRPLFAGGSADNLWHWCTSDKTHGSEDQQPLIKLVRKVHFDTDVATFFWDPEDLKHISQKIVIESSLPETSLWRPSEDWAHALAIVLIGLPILALFWYAADFVAKRILLIDVREPDWLARKPLSPTLGEHIFLVRRDRDVDSLTKGLAFVDVSFAALDGAGNWSDALETLDSTEAGRNVRIIDFEYGINDGAVNEKKLQWLERLLMLSDRTVIVASAVSTSYVPTTPPPPAMPAEETAAYFARWTTLLQCFVTVTAEELDLRHEEWERRNALRTVSMFSAAEPKTWLEKETAYNAFLRRLYDELQAEADLRRTLKMSDPDTDQRRLLDELCERAETYFAGLWSSCREDEKLMLYQLAHNGLANGRNRRTLRRLMARGLVRRNPNLELFSESFRLYVVEAAERENIVTIARENRGASTWDSLRLPFFVIIISFLLLLFATQKDMLTTTTALATALTTGLPILMKLVGAFAEKRSDVKA